MAKKGDLAGTLTEALSQEERRRLEQRIAEHLCLHDSDEDRIIPVQMSPEQRREELKYRLAWLSGRERRVFRLQHLARGGNELARLESFLLGQARKRIHQADPELRSFDGRSIPPFIGYRVSELKATSSRLISLYRTVWHGPNVLAAMVWNLIGSRVSHVATDLFAFTDHEEMLEVYRRKQNKAEIRDLIAERLSTYLNKLDPGPFQQLEAGVMPLYALKPLVLFPFQRLLDPFAVPGTGNTPDQPSEGASANAWDVLPLLEKLYLAVYSIRKLPRPVQLHGDLIDSARKQAETPEVSALTNVAAGDIPSPQEVNELIGSLIERVDSFAARVPLAELIRVCRADPLYRFQAYIPKLHLVQFYGDQLRLRVFSAIDSEFPAVRRSLIDQLVAELFPEGIETFRHYGRSEGPEIRLGLPAFRYRYSLEILLTYVRNKYIGEVQELIRIMGRILPARERDAQERLMHNAGAIEDIADRIQYFDRSFGSEGRDGEVLAGYRLTIERDTGQQRAYQKFVAQKNLEALDLLERGLECLRAIEEALTDIRGMNSPNLDHQFRTFDTRKPRRQSLEEVLKRDTEELRSMRVLIRESIAMDEGV